MYDPIYIMLVGVLVGTLIHDPICNFMNRLHDFFWKDEIRSCENCKWSYNCKSFLTCGKISDSDYRLIVPKDALCDKWEEVQK